VARVHLGIDLGSTTVKLVVLDDDRQLLDEHYVRSSGRPRQTLLDAAVAVLGRVGPTGIGAVGITGSGGAPVAALIGATHVNELIAQSRAVAEYHPEARTIIEIGGQDSKLLSLEPDGDGGVRLVDFSMNALCAAGTGSFLDQQADRLGISIEDEFARLALQSRSPARIAGRCTVFAKSDMIHLQQQGTPLPDILAGLCHALARNFKAVIGKGKAFTPPILFQGGVAYNTAVVRAFEEVLNVPAGGITVPRHHCIMAAIGAALTAMAEHGTAEAPVFRGFDALADAVRADAGRTERLPPLQAPSQGPAGSGDPACGLAAGVIELCAGRTNGAAAHGSVPASTAAGSPVAAPVAGARGGTVAAPVPVWIGIDVGSISTCIAVIDAQDRVLARRYIFTEGRPLEAVRTGLQEVGAELDGLVEVAGVGTTGSGRYLTGDFVGADVVRSEITAQARAAVAFDPAVDTIIEIGGQDSKYIRLQRGTVIDFAMNHACAAGTGSFLEEQAERLRISIESDFARLAFSSPNPVSLGERCTVFMESDLVHHQQQGEVVEDLVGGLAYSIAQNYLNRVVNGRTIGRRVFFQGGVAWNAAVVAAFEQLLDRPVRVPPHHDVSGAIGAAILAREELAQRHAREGAVATRFRGFVLASDEYQMETFECRACPNLCEVRRVTIGPSQPVFYGARCDRFEEAARSRSRAAHEVPDHFAERRALLLESYERPESRNGKRRVGIPTVLVFHDMFPYWHAFFDALGMEVVLSDATNARIVRTAQEEAAIETCFPVKLVFGHVHDLLQRDIDFLFLPSVLNREDPAPGQNANHYCPYVPAASHLVNAHMDVRSFGVEPLTVSLEMSWVSARRTQLRALAPQLGVRRSSIVAAALAGEAAQQEFYAAVQRRGAEVLAQLGPDERAVVIVGRPYNTQDAGTTMDLPLKLRRLGVTPLPMDFLPLRDVDISERYGNMFWRSGHDILAAATIVRNDPRLQAIYVTNFNCGPDSFLSGFFRRIMGDKPYLELEIDEHTADAGVLTRCEAFLESSRR
jgi:predicted CoA-substrate-specific enzyme activase